MSSRVSAHANLVDRQLKPASNTVFDFFRDVRQHFVLHTCNKLGFFFRAESKEFPGIRPNRTGKPRRRFCAPAEQFAGQCAALPALRGTSENSSDAPRLGGSGKHRHDPDSSDARREKNQRSSVQLKSRSFRLVHRPSRRVLGTAKRGHHAQTSGATAPVSDATVLSYIRLNTASEGELPAAQDLSALCYRNNHLRTIIMR